MQEYDGTLASGNRFRATPYMLEITDPTGAVLETLDAQSIKAVTRNGKAVIIQMRDGQVVEFETTSLDDAGRIQALLTPATAAPTVAAPRTRRGLRAVGVGCLLVIVLTAALVAIVAVLGSGDDKPSQSANSSNVGLGDGAKTTQLQSYVSTQFGGTDPADWYGHVSSVYVSGPEAIALTDLPATAAGQQPAIAICQGLSAFVFNNLHKDLQLDRVIVITSDHTPLALRQGLGDDCAP